MRRNDCPRWTGICSRYAFGELDMLVPAHAATIHKSQNSEYPAVVIAVLTFITLCCSGTCSTPVARAASDWSFSSGRRRPSPSRCATSRACGDGRSSASGYVQVHLPHGGSAWRIEPSWQRSFCKIRRCGMARRGRASLDATDLRKLAGAATRAVGRSYCDPNCEQSQCRRDRPVSDSAKHTHSTATGNRARCSSGDRNR